MSATIENAPGTWRRGGAKSERVNLSTSPRIMRTRLSEPEAHLLRALWFYPGATRELVRTSGLGPAYLSPDACIIARYAFGPADAPIPGNVAAALTRAEPREESIGTWLLAGEPSDAEHARYLVRMALADFAHLCGPPMLRHLADNWTPSAGLTIAKELRNLASMVEAGRGAAA